MNYLISRRFFNFTSFICLFIIFIIYSCQNPSETVDKSISTFEIAPGFQIELIASEPLISDPVDMEIDEYGRLYIVEMPGYPLDISGSGKIKMLSDTNGDGKMDKSVTFADSLILPTGILRWKNGILVTDAPNVYYLEDSDGDGKADIKDIVLTGFALSNPQHNVNNPELGIDNWIYLGHEPAVTTTIYEKEFGDRGSDVFFINRPEGVRLPQNAGGRSIRFRPQTFEIELLSSRTQFGQSFDAWGHRFTATNSNHVIQEVIPASYLNRNPDLLVSNSTQSLSDHGNAAEVFPITHNPEHQLLTDVGVITAASGVTLYLGGAFPPGYENVSFVTESVSNLVHADILKSKGTNYVASRLLEGKEFLASTDAWFRPVNMYVGPDGALYVVDYYRQIIEHPEWMAEEVVKSGALYNGTDKGRIYRITPKGTGAVSWSKNLQMGIFTNDQLVEKLADPNIWWRRNAQRLLVDRLSEAVPSLVKMARNSNSPLGRLHALWTLEGIKQLSPELIKMALADPEPGVRENAIRLSEGYLNSDTGLSEALLELVSDDDPKVRFQLLCTLGFIDTPQAAQVRQELMFRDVGDEWVQIAALSTLYLKNSGLLEAVLDRYDQQLPAYASLVRRLSAMDGASQQQEIILQLIKKATDPTPTVSWQAPVLEGLAQGIKSKGSSASSFGAAQNLLINASFENPSLEVREASLKVLQAIKLSDNINTQRAMKKARQIAGEKSLPAKERALGINFLALQNPASHEAFLKEMISPGEPLPVQLSALKALSAIPDETVAYFVLEHWNYLTPEIRDEALNTLMANPTRITMLIDAIETNKIQQSTLGWRRSVRLMAQKDETLRTRARFLLTKKGGQKDDVIKNYEPALTLKGSIIDGKAVFEKNCGICHKMGDETGVPFGPDLSSLKNRRPASILNDILDPNLSIADGYDLWTVDLNNGETVQGVISSETPTAITLLNAGGSEKTIARQDIKSLNIIDISAMPEGWENSIDQQQMADLLAFIRQTQ